MAPLCGSQVLWLMNNQEPFMAVCVLQDSARQCKDEEAVVVVWLPWLISHSIETIWVTLIWGPLHALYSTLYTLYTENYTYCTVALHCRWETWQTWEIHSLLETLKTANYTNLNMDRCTELILVQSAVCALCTVHGARCYGVLQVLCCSTEELLFWELYRFEQTELRTI